MRLVSSGRRSVFMGNRRVLLASLYEAGEKTNG